MASYKIPGVTRVPVTAPDGSAEWLDMRTSTSMSAQTQIAVDAKKHTEGEAFVRFVFAHVLGWSLKDESGDPIPPSFELFDALPWLVVAAQEYVKAHGFLPQQVFAEPDTAATPGEASASAQPSPP
jgi:hypothetical protein